MITVGKMQIRSGVFETNSSSTHSLSVRAIDEKREVPPYVVDGVLIPKNVAIGAKRQHPQDYIFIYETFEEKVAYIACAINSLCGFMFDSDENEANSDGALLDLKTNLRAKLLKGIQLYPQRSFHSISLDTYDVELYAEYGSEYSLSGHDYTTANEIDEQLGKLIRVAINDNMAITDSTIED